VARIVVGTDGSPNAQLALDWAVDEARRREAELVVVRSWRPPYAGEAAYGYVEVTDAVRAGATTQLEEAAAAAEAALGRPVHRVIRCGAAADTLMDESKGADLLVVGARGHGGFLGLLLGSVAEHVARHAPCPVVIVREQASGSD
jgi:nucleotide-binding universal stress UspA family protein